MERNQLVELIEKHQLLQPDPLFAQNEKEVGHNRGWNSFRETLLAILKKEPLNLIA